MSLDTWYPIFLPNTRELSTHMNSGSLPHAPHCRDPLYLMPESPMFPRNVLSILRTSGVSPKKKVSHIPNQYLEWRPSPFMAFPIVHDVLCEGKVVNALSWGSLDHRILRVFGRGVPQGSLGRTWSKSGAVRLSSWSVQAIGEADCKEQFDNVHPRTVIQHMCDAAAKRRRWRATTLGWNIHKEIRLGW